LIQVINAAIGNKHRFDAMKDFFGSVGHGDKAGVWEGVPQDYPNFRKEQRRQLDKQAKKRKAEEMG
jgi:3,8-divinyl chlorophyllide a/chlorophyllide a reductase subunit Y